MYIKKPLLSIVFFSFLFFIGCTNKKEASFTISGVVLNTQQNYAILSKVENVLNNQTVIIDTLNIDENGYFNAEYNLEPNIYNLTFDNKKTLKLAVNNGQKVVINGTDLDRLKIHGSIDTDILNSYETYRKASLKRLVTKIRDSIKNLEKENASLEKIIALRELEVENYKLHLVELTQFIQENMGTSIAIYPTSIRWNSDNLTVLEQVVTDFKVSHPTSTITPQLENRIALLKKIAIGNYVSNIEMPSASNQIMNLNDIKGTVTLIDFWASWCPPCRSESGLLNNLHQTYNADGFEIYGISLDSKRKRWVDALEKDNRNWENVSTLEGFKTPVAQEFGIRALPTNILINAEGKIIAVNIHGKQLKEIIDGLFN
ncbi:MAG: TlpA family protein disulfide reductase [Bacteroidetes bacterium]|nr:TlpA family protein disulfide reductase [Bacteroidota bacterium]